MARKRPRASNDAEPAHDAPEQPAKREAAGLTRAEAHALRRSAPLTPAQFRALRGLAERGRDPLRHI